MKVMGRTSHFSPSSGLHNSIRPQFLSLPFAVS